MTSDGNREEEKGIGPQGDSGLATIIVPDTLEESPFMSQRYFVCRRFQLQTYLEAGFDNVERRGNQGACHATSSMARERNE